MTTPDTTDQFRILRPVSISATAVKITGQTAHAEIGVAGPDVLPILQVVGPDGSHLNIDLTGHVREVLDTLHALAEFLEAELP